MSIPPSDIVRRAAGGGINKYVRDSITEIRKSQLNVYILGNLGIIVGHSNQEPVLDLDEVQATSRTLLSYPVSTRYHCRQMAPCSIVMALALRALLFNW